MKKFWKWFFIVLGILLVLGLAYFAIMFFVLRGSAMHVLNRGFVRPGMMMGRFGRGMMFGMGGAMLLRGLFGIAILVLAGFGIAYLVKGSRQPAAMPALAPVCANCGKPLSAEWKACPYCGTPVQTAVNPPAEATKKPRSKTS